MATMMPTQHRHRSSAEYPLRQEDTDAIVRVAAYHRRDYDLAVIWFSPREHANIRLSIMTPFQRNSNSGLGSLDRLPLELLRNILLQLDMSSLFKFRQTNLPSRQTVDFLMEHRMVVSHGLNLFCALLRTRLGSRIPLLDFHRVLCTKTCAVCGEFGGFVYLLTWTRCCFKCLRYSAELRVEYLDPSQERLYLAKAKSVRPVTFKTLPGTYSMNQSECESRFTIISARQATIPPRPPLPGCPLAFPRPDPSIMLNFMASCALPYYDKRTGNIERGVSCAGCQLALEKGIIGPRPERWVFAGPDKIYAIDGYLEHFRWCEQSQLLWESSECGSRRPTGLPGVAQRGGYFKER
ncbi:hypothetical protein F4821DRAFT_218265 [Hypoxylon rubiginosum]|uniref:Uncharacterized protein n=1 Tax=Hypoxylon rubiginosum TaxID=110542 RepID=A0ACC0CP72_9PEZI|nr:hypothetical protein F4821DRAFT_218265 [Hypoxylon rubiginosum]